MAADTRESPSSKSGTSATTATIQGTSSAPSVVPVAPPNANALPAGAGKNTAGGKVPEAGIIDALKSIKPNEIKEVHKRPCVRDALLTGIGGGFGIGGVRAIWGGKLSYWSLYSSICVADQFSNDLVELQLGCWLVRVWLLPHV